MTKFPYDRFAKDYLKELLKPLGEVEASKEVPGEVRQIDVWFTPYPPGQRGDAEVLGLLGRFASIPSIFEPFRNAVSPSQIRGCMGKLFDIHAYSQRESQRNNTRLDEADLPTLWILSPTVSATILNGCKAEADENNWPTGVYFLGEILKTAIVVIHQLPRTPETLWLRLLGKGNVQKQAINEIGTLPPNHPLRSNALLLLANLQATIEASQNIDREDRELAMELSPLLLQWRDEAIQEGEERGLQRGVMRERRATIENLLRVRFGVLDEQLSGIIERLLELPPEEFTVLLLQLSREELLARFGG
ncbi:hypothetical protein H6S82_23070 [Planktothrix sp. FACHB-1355]|uniref:Flagellar assembly protein H n=1 Tax=Aerosakkonema funiforme FACHB-1375 TaxID=2949571 RepID=A0A926VLK0_9CYAN|nr:MULTISPECIES: hypothetical protein [Oscillatoriales]MBD2185959.1 hypothetical protein [Aerosakkonema funiforme FACHB-1375]MBD3561703.1 hypothetical protein [Planktothrix sp. FACHB-1355]